MIKFFCEQCGKQIKVADAHAGKRAKCPKCASPVVIPEPEAAVVAAAAASTHSRRDVVAPDSDVEAHPNNDSPAPTPSVATRLAELKGASREWSDAKWVSVAVIAGIAFLLVAMILVMVYQTLGGWPTLGLLAVLPIAAWAVVRWKTTTASRSRRSATARGEDRDRLAEALSHVDANAPQQPALADAAYDTPSPAAQPSATAPAVVVYCITCGSMFPVAATFKGRSIACRDCGETVVVPDGNEEARMRRKQAADTTKRLIGTLVTLVLLLGTSPLAIVDLIGGMHREAEVERRQIEQRERVQLEAVQPPKWWVILAWYYAIWVGVGVLIVFGSGRALTQDIEHKNAWGETVGRSTFQTGEVQMFYDVTPWLRWWSIFYLGAPNVLWLCFRLGVHHW